MENISFSILKRLFKAELQLGRVIDYSSSEKKCQVKRLTCQTTLYGSADLKEMRHVETEIRGYEDKIKGYFDSCSPEVWPIKIKDYLSEIDICYKSLKCNIEYYQNNKQSILELAYNLGNLYSSIRNLLQLEEPIHLVPEDYERFSVALGICELAYNIVYDIYERYCPENKSLLKLFPNKFIDEAISVELSKQKNLESNPDFLKVMRSAINEGFFDNNRKWLKASEEGKNKRYGSLIFFIERIKTDLNVQIYKREIYKMLFPDIAEIPCKNLTEYISYFNGKDDIDSSTLRTEIKSFFKEYKRQKDLGPIVPCLEIK